MRPPLALRLAVRQARRSPVTSLLSAAFLALPAGALIALTVSTSRRSSDCGWATCPGDPALLANAAAVTLPFAFAITVIVAANMLVAARRGERMLALLASVGAPATTRFATVIATGFLTGIAAAVLSLLGLPIGWLLLGDVIAHDFSSVLLLAAISVALGVLAAIVPAAVAVRTDANTVLRGIRRRAPRRWRTDRIGAVLAVVGLALVVAGIATSVAAQEAQWRGEGTQSIMASSAHLLAQSLSIFGPMVAITGVSLMLPRLFAMAGRMAGSRLAARLAARDAERSWNRSVSAGIAVLVTTFAIASYLTLAVTSSNVQSDEYWWELREGQMAVPLIQMGDTPDGVFTPSPLDDDDVAEVLRLVEAEPGVDKALVLKGALGPAYGFPVDDSEGYSGRMVVTFPDEGLPHPRLADDTLCGALPQWRCPMLEHPFAFPYDAFTPTIWVADEPEVRLILGEWADASTLAALDRDEALVLDARYFDADGSVTFDWHGEEFVPENEVNEFTPAGAALRSETVDAHLVRLGHRLDFDLIVPTATAERIGLEPVPARVLASPNADGVDDEHWFFDVILADGTHLGSVSPQSAPPQLDVTWVIGALLLGGGISLAVSLVAVGLARVEGRATDRTLAAMGAEPGIRRRISAWYALFVVGTASVIGTTLGFVIGGSSMFSSLAHLSPTALLGAMPWLELAVLAVVMPLVAAGLTWLTPSSGERKSAA